MSEPDPSRRARARDLPAPRRNPSAIGPLFQRVFTAPFRYALAGIIRTGIRPWELTVLSLLTNLVAAFLIVKGAWFVPGLLLIPSGLFDVFDGAVARHRGEESAFGAFLDSVMDRMSDVVLFGAIAWSLAAQGRREAAGLAIAALVVSLLVSHLRAEGEAHGVKMGEGFFQRLERHIALMIALTAPGAMVPVLILLVALGGFTALQRFVSGVRGTAPQKE
ncbi:MAG: CDP-alcohol phosphatidyltransferase family protein [Actinobacteria bacterium]|nr:CDP-alcohol phosphatidyltransferase family protein [Actinomycetota bacterium]